MRHVLFPVILVIGTTACGSSPQVALNSTTSATDTKFYELYLHGDETTDQTAGAPGSHSSLVGTELDQNSGMRDDRFATLVATPAIQGGAKLFFSLGECYSGGMIDDMAALGGDQSVLAAARHTETASYATEGSDGVNVDYTDAFISALADGKAGGEMVAAQTAAVDPFGPNPDAHRISEEMGSEHNQYFASGAGAQLEPAMYAGTGVAILWAGMPAVRDGNQMNLMIDRLLAMGYSPDRIWMLYGGGQAPVTHPVVRDHMVNQAQPVHFLAATQDHLAALVSGLFSGANGPKPDFVFFYAGDHGGLDDLNLAKTGYSGEDPLVTPAFAAAPPARLYGEGLAPLRF